MRCDYSTGVEVGGRRCGQILPSFLYLESNGKTGPEDSKQAKRPKQWLSAPPPMSSFLSGPSLSLIAEWTCLKARSPGLQNTIKMVGEDPYLISDLDRRGRRRSFAERYDPSLKTMIPMRPYARWARRRNEVRWAGPPRMVRALLATGRSVCLSFYPSVCLFMNHWVLASSCEIPARVMGAFLVLRLLTAFINFLLTT